VELFEILFILFFILIPVLEGIRKSRQRRDAPDIEEPTSGPSRPPPRTTTGPPRRYPEPEPEAEPVEAADMVPDDLWEILTGERRERPAPVEPQAEAPDWYEEEIAARYGDEPDEDRLPEEPAWEREADPSSRETFDPAPWRGGAPAQEDEPLVFQPEEALIVPDERRSRPARPRISLRTVVEAPRVKREVSPLMRALQNQDGLRQAVLLKEILGRPKGLQD
jgi:hypothetical protein